MGTLLHLPRTVDIICPLCRQHQKMINTKNALKGYNDNIWYPASPFCCDAMRMLDTPEWNAALDIALANELE